MKCEYCGNDIRPGAKFCTNCGAEQSIQENYDEVPAPAPIPAPAPASGGSAVGDSPKYVDFGEAIRLFFVNYVNFSGRSTRSEFWYAYLFQLLVNFAVGIIESAADISFLSGLVSLVFLIPGIAISFRRLHDTGKSGAPIIVLYALTFVLVVVSVFLLGFVVGFGMSGGESFRSSSILSLTFTALCGLAVLGLSIYILVMFCQPSQPTDNRYGRAPL